MECVNKNEFCHILHVLSFCYDEFCPIFVTSYTFGTFVMTNFVLFLSNTNEIVTNFMYNYSFLCIKLYIYAYFGILSHFLSHGTNFVTFLTPQKPSNTRVFTFVQKFVTFVQILSPVCHVFVTFINRVVMRFIHKIYINVTNIYKSLTKFFKKNKYIVSNFANFVTFGIKTLTNVDIMGFWGVTKWGQTRDKSFRDVTKF